MLKESQHIEQVPLSNYFNEQGGWQIIQVSSSMIDRRSTSPGAAIRCIDRRFGITQNGYCPDAVPLAPSWLGALDGIAAFYSDTSAEARMSRAVRVTRALGFQPAVHGDYIQNEMGCKFRKALEEKRLPNLQSMSPVEQRVLRAKYGVHYTELFDECGNEVEGFILNNEPWTTVLPDDGRFYPIDTWFASMAGISAEQYLPKIELCGQLMLPETRRLFVIMD